MATAAEPVPGYPLIERKKSYGAQALADQASASHIEKTTTHSAHFSHDGLSIMTATSLISGKVVGLGIQILPGAVARTGAWGFTIAIAALLLSAFSGTILSRSWILLRQRYSKYRTEINRYPYPTLAYEAYGPWGRRVASILLYLYGIAICTTGLLILADNLHILLESLGITLTTCIYLPIISVFVCPLLWMGTPKDFWFVGYFAIATATAASIFLFVGASLDHDKYKIHHDMEVNVVAFFSAVGDIVFAYAGQSVYPTVQHDMKSPEDFTKSVLWGYGVMALLYFPTTIACVVIYGEAFKEKNLDNILDLVTSNFIRIPFIILMMIYTIPVIIITSNPFFQDAEDFFNIPYEFTWKRPLLRSIYVLLLLFIASTFPHFTTFLPLVGGPLVAVVNFILPSVIYSKLVRMEPMTVPPDSIIPICLTNTVHVVIVIVALLAALMSSGTAIYSFVNGSGVVDLPCYVFTRKNQTVGG
ncbi:uncharacterized protein [Diadema antillarum]|uniref:uncharacterized protein n=1 Tax=Diadema antillarum TaxID=105358 RepID=UPI003A89296A